MVSFPDSELDAIPGSLECTLRVGRLGCSRWPRLEIFLSHLGLDSHLSLSPQRGLEEGFKKLG
jgi:hypothetical protein